MFIGLIGFEWEVQSVLIDIHGMVAKTMKNGKNDTSANLRMAKWPNGGTRFWQF